jgi:hypothetical protein
MLYYYTPIFQENDVFTPGKDDGVGNIVSASSDILAGSYSPKCDHSASIFVLVVPDATVEPQGWLIRTKSEVNADYPGLIP